MDVYQILTFALPPATGVISWFAGRHTRNSGTLQTMQSAIDMLVSKNADLYTELAKLRIQNDDLQEKIVELSRQNTELQSSMETLQRQNTSLKTEIDSLRKTLREKRKAQKQHEIKQ